MRIKILFNSLFIFLFLAFILIIFSLVFNRSVVLPASREKEDFISLLPQETASFVKIKKEFLSFKNIPSVLYSGIIQDQALELLESLGLKEIVEFDFQKSHFFLLKGVNLSGLQGNSFYGFGPQGNPVYFNSQTGLYSFQEKNFLILNNRFDQLKDLMQTLADPQASSLRTALNLKVLWNTIDPQAVLLGFYQESKNFQIKSPFLFSLSRSKAEIILPQPSSKQVKSESLKFENFHFPDALAQFYGSNPGFEMQFFSTVFLKDNEFFDQLKRNYNLDLEKFILQKERGYQLYLFSNNDFLLITPSQIDLPALKQAWKLFTAESYPQKVEKVLPDGSKAVHLIRDPDAFSFTQQELFGVKADQLKKGSKNLLIARIEPFWVIADQDKFLKMLLDQLKQKENLSFWTTFKNRLSQPQKGLILSYEIEPAKLNQLITIKTDYLDFQKLRLQAYQDQNQGTLSFIFYFKKK